MTKIDLTPLSDVEPFFLVEKTAVHPGRVMLALGSYVEDLKDLPASGLGGYLDHVESNHGSCLVQYTPTEIGRLRITPMRKFKDEYVPVEIGSYHAQRVRVGAFGGCFACCTRSLTLPAQSQLPPWRVRLSGEGPNSPEERAGPR